MCESSEYLEKYRSNWEVEIKPVSSWSCFHGVGRWSDDCGCSTGGHPGWNQKWRKPLREALDYLRDEMIAIFKKNGKKYYEYKESQRPFIEKQKEFEKKKRKFLQEVKMSKEEPTKKQLYYYDKLCKRYNIEKKDVETLSKLDIRDEIERILNEYSRNNENLN